MTLQASGPISLGNLKNEFGGNASPKLSDYYRGGRFNFDPNTKVPNSGTVSLGKFYGLTKNFPMIASTPMIIYSYFPTINLTLQDLYIDGTLVYPASSDVNTYYSISEYLTVDKVPNLPIIQIEDKVMAPASQTSGMDGYFIKDGNVNALEISVNTSGLMRVWRFADYKLQPQYIDPSTGAAYGIFDKEVTLTFKDSSGRLAIKKILIRLQYYS